VCVRERGIKRDQRGIYERAKEDWERTILFLNELVDVPFLSCDKIHLSSLVPRYSEI
jgi:hypothetical protein